MSDIFISYANEDSVCAKAISEALTSKGCRVWRDRENLYAGQEFRKEIDCALRDAKCVLVLWSQHSINSTWVGAEADAGFQGAKLVPVRIEDHVKIPVPFTEMHTEDLSAWDGSAESPAFSRILTAIERNVGRPSSTLGQDIILTHRLESLKRDLERVTRVQDYMQDIKELLTDESTSQFWRRFTRGQLESHRGTGRRELGGGCRLTNDRLDVSDIVDAEIAFVTYHRRPCDW